MCEVFTLTRHNGLKTFPAPNLFPSSKDQYLRAFLAKIFHGERDHARFGVLSTPSLFI
jgi:hypothetical protein